MSWDDYRFNGLRKAIEEARARWAVLYELANNGGGTELAKETAAEARGHIFAFDTSLRLLETWVEGVQEEEARDQADR